MRPTRILPPLLLLSLVAFVGTARATVMVEVPLDAMVRDADAIVVATVRRSEARLVLDPRRGAEPHTFTELAVSEWIVGAGAGRVVVEEIGGDLQGETLHVAGTPRYAPGEEVIVFLERRRGGSLRTLAMSQGKLSIRRGVAGSPDSVRRDLREIAFARWAGAGGMQVGHAHDAAVELDVFLRTVRRLARDSRVSRPSPSATSGVTR